MVENTIQAIKETEAKADAVVREAESKYRDILDEAAKKAEALKSEQIQNMKQKAQSDMEKAKEKVHRIWIQRCPRFGGKWRRLRSLPSRSTMRR